MSHLQQAQEKKEAEKKQRKRKLKIFLEREKVLEL